MLGSLLEMEALKSYPMPKVGLLEWAWSRLRTHGHEGELFWAALLLAGDHHTGIEANVWRGLRNIWMCSDTESQKCFPMVPVCIWF